jgi:hypothetical protein
MKALTNVYTHIYVYGTTGKGEEAEERRTEMTRKVVVIVVVELYSSHEERERKKKAWREGQRSCALCSPNKRIDR